MRTFCVICQNLIASEADQRLMGKGPAHISCFNNWREEMPNAKAIGPCVICDQPLSSQQPTAKYGNGFRHADCKPPRKGPRKGRSAARTVCYVEKLFARFPLEQRKAMYAMLASVCQPEVTENGG